MATLPMERMSPERFTMIRITVQARGFGAGSRRALGRNWAFGHFGELEWNGWVESFKKWRRLRLSNRAAEEEGKKTT